MITEQYRFDSATGSLYEYSKQHGGYLHCFQASGARNIRQALYAMRRAQDRAIEG